MTIHPDLGTLYVTGSVLVTTVVVYVLYVVGSIIGRALFGGRTAVSPARVTDPCAEPAQT